MPGILWSSRLGSAPALVLGYIARGRIRPTGEGGDGLAIAGIVLGWVGVGFLTLGLFGAILRPGADLGPDLVRISGRSADSAPGESVSRCSIVPG
ncbi:DUF4190 domain-containing protein [Pseudonocardia sp. K10HN5]|uniref:DUF4190 domain-containing protein n=1 Tax=Pseudonocardia acidicola TaxID=2724939 RepID=A0ABX1SEV2_9PSEU|nr:DUF4190 domain-containing protein [Pseudonocardia acidicola]